LDCWWFEKKNKKKQKKNKNRKKGANLRFIDSGEKKTGTRNPNFSAIKESKACNQY